MEKVLLLDLDGTILNSSCVLEFANYLVETNIIKGDESHNLWLSNKKNDDNIRMFAEHFRSELVGKKEDYIQTLFKQFFNDYQFSYNDDVLKVINDCKEKGYYCMIISGTVDFMVKEIANKLEINGKGSVYNVENGLYTGKIDIPMFSQKEKQKVIDLIINKNTIDVIGAGDTVSDVPIALASDVFFLVNPNLYTLKEYKNLGIDYILL